MPKYTCEKCNTVFTKKLEYNKHIKDCDIEEVNDEVIHEEIITSDQLKNKFNTCLNILRDNEH
jgi:hypothetical protein